MSSLFVWFFGKRAVAANPGNPPQVPATPAMPAVRGHWWAVALLVILISGAISLPFVWYYLHDTNIPGADKPATTTAVVPAVPETSPAPPTPVVSALVPAPDLIRALADSRPKVAKEAGCQLILRQEAVESLVETYASPDARTKARAKWCLTRMGEWTRAYYNEVLAHPSSFAPAIVVAVKELVGTPQTEAGDVKTAKDKAAEMRELGASLIQKAEEEKERFAADMEIVRRDAAAMYYGRGRRTATDDIHLANAEAGAINYHQLRGEGFRLYYTGRRMEVQITLEEAKERLPEVRTTPASRPPATKPAVRPPATRQPRAVPPCRW